MNDTYVPEPECILSTMKGLNYYLFYFRVTKRPVDGLETFFTTRDSSTRRVSVMDTNFHNIKCSRDHKKKILATHQFIDITFLLLLRHEKVVVTRGQRKEHVIETKGHRNTLLCKPKWDTFLPKDSTDRDSSVRVVT